MIKNDELLRFQKLNEIFSDSHICEIENQFNKINCNIDYCENCPLGIGDGICLKNTFITKWKLAKENTKLKEENKKLNEKIVQLEAIIKKLKNS